MNKLILNFALYTFLTMAFSADIYAPKPLSLVFEDAIGSQCGRLHRLVLLKTEIMLL